MAAEQAKAEAAAKARAAEEAAAREMEGRRLKEQERHHRAVEGRPPPEPKATRYQIVPGPGGKLYAVDPTNPTAPPMPVGGGEQLRKPTDIPVSEKDTLEELSQQVRNLEGLSQSFQDNYAGGGAVGEKITDVQRAMGSLAPKDAQPKLEFWAKYDEMVNLPLRNKTFGASLSPGEKQSWDNARRVKPGGDPEVARRALKEMADIARRKRDARVKTLEAQGVERGVLDALTGGGEPAPQAPAAAPSGLSPDEAAELQALEKRFGGRK
jgi:hypothetical protein